VFGLKEKMPVVILASLPVIVTFWLLDTFFKQ
jgi:hypothetical protein